MTLMLIGFAAGALLSPLAIVVGTDLALARAERRMEDEEVSLWPRKSTLRRRPR